VAIGRQPLTRRCKTRAVSLIELIIVFFVFSIIIVMVADMTRLAIFSQRSTTEKVEARRLASTQLTRIRFEFSTCRSLASPDPNVGTQGWWAPSVDEKLTLHVNKAGGSKAISYWHDSDTGLVWREIGGEQKPILREVENFQFQQNPGASAHMMKARVKMKKLATPVTVWGRAIRV
jgi:type II secretory pathway pseudopilin PulG